MAGFIQTLVCSCGLTTEYTIPNDQEEQNNCSNGCCLSVYLCPKDHRTVIRWETPEME